VEPIGILLSFENRCDEAGPLSSCNIRKFVRVAGGWCADAAESIYILCIELRKSRVVGMWCSRDITIRGKARYQNSACICGKNLCELIESKKLDTHLLEKEDTPICGTDQRPHPSRV
jgi:hypothetical protein